MSKSTFFMVEVDHKLSLKELEEIENAIQQVVGRRGKAVVSNMQYKKGAYF